ncbi:MAG: hypothetical protein ACXVRS_00650 [Gaiellaceae bacterium]
MAGLVLGVADDVMLIGAVIALVAVDVVLGIVMYRLLSRVETLLEFVEGDVRSIRESERTR